MELSFNQHWKLLDLLLMKPGMNSPRMIDADLLLQGAMPNAANGTTTLAFLDLGPFILPNSGTRRGLGELDCWVDGLTPTMVPDTRTVTLSIEASDDKTFASGVKVLSSQTFTASGGVGIPETHLRENLPSDCPQYVRFKGQLGASTTDSSAVVLYGTLHCPIIR